MFYYESQLKRATKTDAIYVHRPFAIKKPETPLLTEYKFQDPHVIEEKTIPDPTTSSSITLSLFNDRSLTEATRSVHL